LQEDLRKIITVPLYVLGFVLMGLLSGYLAFKILSFSKTVEVPDLRGKTMVEANGLLIKQGLYLKVEGEEYDLVIVPGRIVRQDVPPGNKVKEQRGIKVFLSRGPKVWTIPELTGRTIDEAESAVSKSGLRIEKIIRLHSNSVEKDRVIAQRPHPDEPPGGDPTEKPQDIMSYRGLSLIVSSGLYETVYVCPDFTGSTKDDAAGLAEKLRLIPEFTGSGEKVKAQKPKPNALVNQERPSISSLKEDKHQ
jgi:beta-lactam-binding protein with PASTA domain